MADYIQYAMIPVAVKPVLISYNLWVNDDVGPTLHIKGRLLQQAQYLELQPGHNV